MINIIEELTSSNLLDEAKEEYISINWNVDMSDEALYEFVRYYEWSNYDLNWFAWYLAWIEREDSENESTKKLRHFILACHFIEGNKTAYRVMNFIDRETYPYYDEIRKHIINHIKDNWFTDSGAICIDFINEVSREDAINFLT